jgi:hypothetical protein
MKLPRPWWERIEERGKRIVIQRFKIERFKDKHFEFKWIL